MSYADSDRTELPHSMQIKPHLVSHLVSYLNAPNKDA